MFRFAIVITTLAFVAFSQASLNSFSAAQAAGSPYGRYGADALSGATIGGDSLPGARYGGDSLPGARFGGDSIPGARFGGDSLPGARYGVEPVPAARYGAGDILQYPPPIIVPYLRGSRYPDPVYDGRFSANSFAAARAQEQQAAALAASKVSSLYGGFGRQY